MQNSFLQRTSLLKFLSIGCALLALGVSSSRLRPREGEQNNPDQAKCLGLLYRAISPIGPKNVIAIMDIGNQNGSDGQSVKVVISKSGLERIDVLGPLSEAGKVIVDDMKVRQAYDPDRRLITIGPSGRGVEDVRRRVKRIGKNYFLSLSTSTILGLDVDVIEAKPKGGHLPTQKIYFEPQSDFVMKMETVDRHGHVNSPYETRFVTFPKELDDSEFSIKLTDKVRTERVPGPHDVSSAKAAAKILGFLPVEPHSIPFGFEITSRYTVKGEGWKSYGLELTDGFLYCSVYQTKAGSVQDEDAHAFHDNPESHVRAGDIDFVILSNVDRHVKRRILEAFAKMATQKK